MNELSAEAYKNSAEHLLAELAHLDLFVQNAIARVRSSTKDEQEMFRGMYVSDADVDRILAAPDQDMREDAKRAFSARVAESASRLEACKRASREQGIALGLPYVSRLFRLSPLEQQILLMCLAPEMDGKYERLFGYLHDDISRRRPSVGLILNVLCADSEQRMQALKLFSPQSRLFRSGLIKATGRQDESSLRRTLLVDEIILNYLLGVPGPGGDFESCFRMYSPTLTLDGLRWRPQFKTKLKQFVERHLDPAGAGKRLVLHLHGPEGTGKKTLAGALCAALELPMFVVDSRELLRQFSDLDSAFRSVFRYSLLLQSPVYVDHFDVFTAEESKYSSCMTSLCRVVEEMSLITFLGTEDAWRTDNSFEGVQFLSIHLPPPDVRERQCIWSSVADTWPVHENVIWDDIAAQFRLTPGRIERAFQTAVSLAAMRDGQNICLQREDLHGGCYAQSNRKLMTLAQRIVPQNTWEDLILPDNTLNQVREICSQLKHRQRVYQDWGFERKLVRGKGMCALFHGHSGVGKTMAVEVLAQELCLEIYKIDLSTVVSKFIGETEKNLSRIFQEAEDSNSILFFDEADALFGKRSEVKDAHDRYANIEINYLLQRMEEFDGLVVLATNLRRNIDEGFFRRMHFVVELPFPDEAHRYRIWKQHFPQTAPLAADIDFDYLAKRFVLAGGHIRNVAVNAAFLAASNSGTIHMEHVIRATRREYEKMGKVCTENEFAPYQWALRELSGLRPAEARP